MASFELVERWTVGPGKRSTSEHFESPVEAISSVIPVRTWDEHCREEGIPTNSEATPGERKRFIAGSKEFFVISKHIYLCARYEKEGNQCEEIIKAFDSKEDAEEAKKKCNSALVAAKKLSFGETVSLENFLEVFL